MPEIHPSTGNYHDRQDHDVYWSVYDRLYTPYGTRVALPGYGFPHYTWPQLSNAELQGAVGQAVATDELVDLIDFDRNPLTGDVIVNIQTNERVGGW